MLLIYLQGKKFQDDTRSTLSERTSIAFFLVHNMVLSSLENRQLSDII